MIGIRDGEGLPLPFAHDPEDVGPHFEDMEFLLHHTQRRLDTVRLGRLSTTAENLVLTAELDKLRTLHHITSEENGALALQLFELRKEHEISTARNRALASQLRATRLGRNRLAKKIESLQVANTTLRGRLTTAKEDLATRDSTLEELEEEIVELRKENADLLPVDDIQSDTDGMDMSDQSEQDDDDLLGEEEDPEEILFDGDFSQD